MTTILENNEFMRYLHANSESICSDEALVYKANTILQGLTLASTSSVSSLTFNILPTPHAATKSKSTTIHLGGLLNAILEYSKISEGQRYVASAMVAAAAASVEVVDGSVERYLILLAEDWLYLLLWPIKKAFRRPHVDSDASTLEFGIGLQDVHDGATVEGAPPSLRTQVLRRDGHRCVVTGTWDKSLGWSIPNVGTEEDKVGFVDATFIFPRSLVIRRASIARDMELELGSETENTPSLTVDLLLRFTGLNPAFAEEWNKIIDTPQNVLVLRSDWRKAL